MSFNVSGSTSGSGGGFNLMSLFGAAKDVLSGDPSKITGNDVLALFNTMNAAQQDQFRTATANGDTATQKALLTQQAQTIASQAQGASSRNVTLNQPQVKPSDTASLATNLTAMAGLGMSIFGAVNAGHGAMPNINPSMVFGTLNMLDGHFTNSATTVPFSSKKQTPSPDQTAALSATIQSAMRQSIVI